MAKKNGGGRNFISRARKRTSPTTDRPRKKAAGPKQPDWPDSHRKETYEEGLVFVGMSFQQEGMDDVFTAIKETCKSVKLTALRVDENVTSGFIILEIVDLIERAEFLIFDLTFERPNVYYELGYAHGVGNAPSNILLLAKDGTDLHFDIAALRVHFYKSTEHLRKLVKETLKGMLKVARN